MREEASRMGARKRKTPSAPQRLNGPPLTRTPLPPDARVQPTAGPWLYATLLGNGRMLVCLDDTGGIAQLFYPAIDAGPNVRSLLLGLLIARAGEGADGAAGKPRVSWLAGAEWEHSMRHVPHAAAVRVVSINAVAGIQVERTLIVEPEHDVLRTEITISNQGAEAVACGLVTYAGCDIGYRQSGTTAYFDTQRSSLTFFNRDCYLALASSAPVSDFGCDKLSVGEPDYVFAAAESGTFNRREYAIGQVSGALCHDLGTLAAGGRVTCHTYLCGGRSLDAVTALVERARVHTAGFAEGVAWWERQVGAVRLDTSHAAVREVYERSLMVLRLLTDGETGGMLAAAECDPDYRSCGGYGWCWPRDGAYLAHALDVARQHELARHFYDWALRSQEPSGVWYQRYAVSGELAPVWGLVQFDETGAVVWAICRHIQLTGDEDYARRALPQLVRACAYMRAALDAETGLAPITKDLWEERDGISSYACACTWGAFHELAALAERLDETGVAAEWSRAADELRAAIATHLWDERGQRFRRGLKLRVPAQEVERLRREHAFSAEEISEKQVAGRTYFERRIDATIDASLLGYSIPFGVFSPDDPRMLATAEAVARALTSPLGGVIRYEGDGYRGGNPWVICTLWLAWQDVQAGKVARALAAYHWVLEHRTSLDLLPEQVDRHTGEPCWVVPLAWSHAMFLLVTHALDERGLLP